MEQHRQTILTIHQVAAMLQCDRKTVLDRVHKKKLAARRDGKRLIFLPADVQDYLETLPPAVEPEKVEPATTRTVKRRKSWV